MYVNKISVSSTWWIRKGYNETRVNWKINSGNMKREHQTQCLKMIS